MRGIAKITGRTRKIHRYFRNVGAVVEKKVGHKFVHKFPVPDLIAAACKGNKHYACTVLKCSCGCHRRAA